MKRFYWLLFALTVPTFCIAQTPFRLWGVADRGPGGAGTIFNLNPDGSGFRNVHNFLANEEGSNPASSCLVQADDGFIYGVTVGGGKNNDGVLFRLNSDGSGYKKLYDFDYSIGSSPYTTISMPDGFLYGILGLSAPGKGPGIFKIKRDGTEFTRLHDFDKNATFFTDTNGLIAGSDGMLYGTVYSENATTSRGLVFKIATDGSGFEKIQMNGSDGSWTMMGRVVEGAGGYLYGSTWSGGSQILSSGTVFKVAKDGTNFRVIHEFSSANVTEGTSPYGTMIQGSDGYLYGQTFYGGLQDKGTIFKLLPDGSGFAKIYDFTGPDGFYPVSLLQESPGHLVGCTANGVIFRINTNGSNFVKVAEFNNASWGVSDGPIRTSTGVFFGSVYYGASNNNGFIYEFSGNTLKTIKDFPESSPKRLEALTQTTDGSIYGLGRLGGAFGQGSIFRLMKDGTNYESLVDFGPTQNDSPVGSLMQATNGSLYGVANKSLYTLTPGSTTKTKLIDFDGRFTNLKGKLLQTTTGDLVGISKFGQSNGGWIYKLDQDGSNFNPVFALDGNSQGSGSGMENLVQASDGYLYGFNGSCVLFRVRIDGSDFSIVYRNNNLGYQTTPAENNFIEGMDGFLYGTLESTYLNYGGILYKIKKDGTSFTTLINFDGLTYGSQPTSGIIQGPDGYLYGTTYAGGAKNFGVVYRVKPDGTDFKKLVDFDRNNGANTFARLMIDPGKMNQSVTFNALPTKKMGDAPFTLNATSSAGLPITYQSSDVSIATISGSTLTIKGAGNVTITASQVNDPNYYSASATSNLTVAKGDQLITFGALEPKTTKDAPFSPGASASSGLAITYTSSNSQVATVSGGVITIVGAGTTVITASQPGNGNYNAAASVNQTLTVALATTVTGLESTEDFILYPNPAKEELTIQIPSYLRGPSEITIFSINGKRMESRTSNAKTVSLDLRSYPPGIYIVKLSLDKKTITRNFVKE